MSSFRLVAVGGGTGLSTLLHGLKRYVSSDSSAPRSIAELTAIVTVSDDGGSSGRLRRQLRVLPPGDIRNCLVALSGDETLLSRLFSYRFTSGEGLRGHSFGNLFLAALTRVTGDFTDAVKLSSEVLAVRGHILPSTTSNVTLVAEMADGRRLRGESRIGRSRGRILRVRLVPRNCRPLPETLEALAAADLITIGPGSLFTSLIPNLLVNGFAQAMAASRALRVFICNVMTQPGETIGFTASDHIKAIYSHSGPGLFDLAIVNNGAIPVKLSRRYSRRRAAPVMNDISEIESLGVRAVEADLVTHGPADSENASDRDADPAFINSLKGFIRHHPDRLARLLLELAMHSVRKPQGVAGA